MNQFNTTSYTAILQYSTFMRSVICSANQNPTRSQPKISLILADRTQAKA